MRYVVKVVGANAGKGVFVSTDLDETMDYIRSHLKLGPLRVETVEHTTTYWIDGTGGQT